MLSEKKPLSLLKEQTVISRLFHLKSWLFVVMCFTLGTYTSYGGPSLEDETKVHLETLSLSLATSLHEEELLALEEHLLLTHPEELLAASSAVIAATPALLALSPQIALRSSRYLWGLAITSAVVSSLVMRSQWGNFKLFNIPTGLDESLKKAGEEISDKARKAAGTIEGQVKEIIEASNRSVHTTLDHLKDQSRAVEGGVSDQVGRILDDIHRKIQKELTDVAEGKTGVVEPSLEAVRELWNKAIYERLTSLDEYLEKILDEIFGDDTTPDHAGISMPPALKKKYYLTKMGLSTDASWEEVSQRFKEIAKENHPDLHGSDEKKIQRFIKAQKAYSSLKDIYRQGGGGTAQK